MPFALVDRHGGVNIFPPHNDPSASPATLMVAREPSLQTPGTVYGRSPYLFVRKGRLEWLPILQS